MSSPWKPPAKPRPRTPDGRFISKAEIIRDQEAARFESRLVANDLAQYEASLDYEE